MPSLEIKIGRIQLFRRAPFLGGRVAVVPSASINGQEGVRHTLPLPTADGATGVSSLQQPDDNDGFDNNTEYAFEFSEAVMSDRVEVMIVDTISGATAGRCVISLRRLVRKVIREQFFPIATVDDTPTIAGFTRISVYSPDMGIKVFDDDEQQAQRVLQAADYDLKVPQLARMLQVAAPWRLAMADVILCEGLESADEYGQQSPIIKDVEAAANPQNSVVTLYNNALAELIMDAPILKSEYEVSIAVKSANDLKLADGSRIPSPKVMLTTGSQETCTVTEPMTHNPTYTNQRGYFCVVGPQMATLQVTVYDEVDGADLLIGWATMSFRSVTLERNSIRTIPIVTLDGAYAGTVTVDIYTEDFGNTLSAEDEFVIRDHYKRVTAHLRRFDEPRLAAVDELICVNLMSLNALMASLVEQYGLEVGSAQVSVRVMGIDGLRYPPTEDATTPYQPVATQVVLSIRSGTSDASIPPIEYRGGRLHLEASAEAAATFDMASESDPIVITVTDKDTGLVLGCIHTSAAALQAGVPRRRTLALIAGAGTALPTQSGTIHVELYSEQIGQVHPVDEAYDAAYRRRLCACLAAVRPTQLHLYDVLMSTTYDLEALVNGIEDEALEAGLAIGDDGCILDGTAPVGTLTVSVKEAVLLPDACAKPFVFQLQVEDDTQTLPAVAGTSVTVKPNTTTFRVSYVGSNLSIALVSARTMRVVGRALIPIPNLQMGVETERWYDVWCAPYTPQARTHGKVRLGLLPTNCGGESGTGEAIELYGDEEVEAAPIEIEVGEDERPVCMATSKFDENGEPLVHVIAETVVVAGKPHTFTCDVRFASNIMRPEGTRSLVLNAYAELKVRDKVVRSKCVSGDLHCVPLASQLTFDLSAPTPQDVLIITIVGVDDGKSTEIGTTHIDVTRVLKGRLREISLPLVRYATTGRAEVRGYITLTIGCNSWGRALQPADVAPTRPQAMMRLKDYYAAYIPEQLHLLDFLYNEGMDFEVFMANNVEKFGPEPDTYPLQITVVKGSDFTPPSVVMADGYGILLEVGQDRHSTSVVTDEHPIYNETFTSTVSRKHTSSLNVVVYKAGKEYGRAMLSTRNLPPNSVKRRTVTIVRNATTPEAECDGTVTLEFLSDGYGCNSLPSEEDEQALRERVTAQLQRYAPQELHKVEYLIGEYVGNEDALMIKLIADYNCLPGDARLAVTVKEVRNLTQNGKAVEKGNPYVKIKTHMEKVSTRKLTNVRDGYFDETFTFTMATPEKDYLQVSVYNADIGVDHLYGEALVSINNLQRGVPRTVTAMIVQKPGTRSATFAGYITLVLRSDDFGSASTVDINHDSQWRQRYKNFFSRYCPERLHRIQAIAPSDEYMAKLVREYGPEPIATELSLEIVECRDVVGHSGSATVLVSSGIDTLTTRNVHSQGSRIVYNEKFTLGITDATTDTIAFTVQRQRDAKEYGRLVIGLADLTPNQTKDMWAHIVAGHATDKALVVGSLRVKLTLSGYEPVDAVRRIKARDYTSARRRLECILLNVAPRELHTMEVILTRNNGNTDEVLKGYLAKFPRGDATAPVTVRLRDLVTQADGIFCLKAAIERSKAAGDPRTVVRSANLRMARGVATKIEGKDIVGCAMVGDPVNTSLTFSLHAVRGTATTEVSTCRIAVGFCEPDFFSSRALSFFNASGECIANASVEVRTIVDTLPPIFDHRKWVDVSRDVVSALAKYDPDALADVDSIARGSDNLTTLHGNIIRQIVGAPANANVSTVYLNNVTVDLASPQLMKEIAKNSYNLALIVEGRPSSVGKKYCSDSTTLYKEGVVGAPLVLDASILVMSPMMPGGAIRTLHDDASPTAPVDEEADVFGATTADPSITSPSSPVDTIVRSLTTKASLRMDFVDIQQCSAAIRLIAKGKHGMVTLAEGEISLLPLLTGLLSPQVRQEVPITGVDAVVGVIGFEFATPVTQTCTRAMMGIPPTSDERALLGNRSYILYYYGRTLAYLSRHKPSLVRSLHRTYFDAVLMKGLAGCQQVLAGYVNEVGADDDDSTEQPPTVM